jgi:acyl carrier protein
MEQRELILNKISEILADIIDADELELTEQDSPQTIEDWDSLAHFQMVMEIQNEFSIKFGAAEIQKWKNVADIINSIESKLA